MDESGVKPLQRKERYYQDAEDHTEKLSARVYSWTQDIERTKDLVQRVHLKYLEQMEAEGWEREICNELAYLTRMARNLLIDRWRAEGRTEWISFEGEPDDGLMKDVVGLVDGFDVQNKILFDELLKTLPLRTIFGKLSKEKTELVRLYYFEDFSVEEVAEKLKVHPDLIEFWITRIEATVRARVRKICGKAGLFRSDS
jgi:RNA polymerase sigma factor (sigma-70 family)